MCVYGKMISFRVGTRSPGHITPTHHSLIISSSVFCFYSLHLDIFVLSRLEMPKDEVPNHNCIKHLRSVVQQQQTKIADLEKTAAEHKHQLAEQVSPKHCFYSSPIHRNKPLKAPARTTHRSVLPCTTPWGMLVMSLTLLWWKHSVLFLFGAETGHPAPQSVHEGDPKRKPQPAESGGEHRV